MSFLLYCVLGKYVTSSSSSSSSSSIRGCNGSGSALELVIANVCDILGTRIECESAADNVMYSWSKQNAEYLHNGQRVCDLYELGI